MHKQMEVMSDWIKEKICNDKSSNILLQTRHQYETVAFLG